MMDEIEVLEMAEERPYYRAQDIKGFMRKVMKGQRCYVCHGEPVVIVKFKTNMGSAMHVECKEHWAEARQHPEYLGAEEL